MLIVVYLLAVVLVLFVAAVVATHDSAGLADAPADRADVGLPDGPLQPEDLAEVRFGMVLRGYRMAEVDDTLTRVGAELAARDARIRDLEQALADVVEPQLEEAEARWTPPNTQPAPAVSTPSVVTADQLVVPEPQVVAVPSRIPTVVRSADLGPAAVPVAAPPTTEPAAEEPAAPVEEPPVEEPTIAAPPSPYGGFDDLFPEVLAPEPAAEGTAEATDVTDAEAPSSGDQGPED